MICGTAAISATLLALPAAAQSSVTVYGVMDVSAGITDDGVAHRRVVDSGVGAGSRLGFRGVEDLGGGLAANFALEMGINADNGTQTQGGLAFGRQAWVGLASGNAWTVSMGRQYSPMNLALLFSDTMRGSYWGNLLGTGNGAWQASGSTPGSGTFQTSGRVDNSILGTATLGPVLVRAMVAAGNETPNHAGQLANVSASYSSGPVFAVASYGRIRQSNSMLATGASPAAQTEQMIGGSYDAGWAQVYAGYYGFRTPLANRAAGPASGLDPRISRSTSNWVGVRVPLAGGTLMGQFLRTTMNFAVTKSTSRTLAAAYEYPLSKRTSLYASVAKVDNGDAGLAYLAGSTTLLLPGRAGANLGAYSLGLRHSF